MVLSKPEPNQMKIYKYSNETESFNPEKPKIRIYSLTKPEWISKRPPLSEKYDIP